LAAEEKKRRAGRRARDKPVEQFIEARAGGGTGFMMGSTISGELVNERTSMQVAAVYACVRILAETVASLPLHVYRNSTNGGREKAEDHPLYYLLHDEPNPDMTSFTFRETLMTHLLLWGNAYAQVVRNGYGQVIGLYPLLPNRMDVSRAPSGRLVYTYNRDGEEARPSKKTGDVELRQDEVLHIPGLGFDGIIGYSPIAMARNAIGLGMAAERYGANFFGNGGHPSGLLTHDGKISDPEKLKADWAAAHGGMNSGGVAVLEEAMKYQALSVPPEDAQFLETRKFQTAEIARIYRVPPHMIGDLEKATFSNIEHLSIDFAKFTIGPWCSRLEQGMRKSLLLPADRRVYGPGFNIDGLLRGDYKSRMEGYSIGRQNGFFSTNDIRSLENMDRIPQEDGGDAYLVNGNMISLSAAMRAGIVGGADE